MSAAPHANARVHAAQTPGRKLLVATNAAEEGLDLPCCEFVVRFSPPSTGIQLVQGRGRARKLGAQYFCLLQVRGSGVCACARCSNEAGHRPHQAARIIGTSASPRQSACAHGNSGEGAGFF